MKAKRFILRTTDGSLEVGQRVRKFDHNWTVKEKVELKDQPEPWQYLLVRGEEKTDAKN